VRPVVVVVSLLAEAGEVAIGFEFRQLRFGFGFWLWLRFRQRFIDRLKRR
jgi:hypothetical protein